MHKFVRNLLTEWRKLKLPFAGETILIAVSGGADSVALALALHDLKQAKKLTLNFSVAHFNHKLRGAESDSDEDFVRNLAGKLEFEFVSAVWNSESKIKNQKKNLEQSARQARYNFLQDAAERENAGVVLTAHTVNDQAETLLLNLIRGSGAEGLGAMRKIRKLSAAPEPGESEIEDAKSKILLIRPLLGWATRDETEDFVKHKKNYFRHDTMNDDEKFARVKVRKRLIPLLEREFNPKVIFALAQTAFLLQKETDSSYNVSNHLISDELFVKDFQNLAEPETFAVIRKWLKRRRGNLRRIQFSHIESIARLILSRKSGRKIELPGGEVVIKKAGKLIFEKLKVEKSRSAN